MARELIINKPGNIGGRRKIISNNGVLLLFLSVSMETIGGKATSWPRRGRQEGSGWLKKFKRAPTNR